VRDYFRYNVLLGISLAFSLATAIFIRSEEILKKVWLLILGTLFITLLVAYLELIFGIRLKGSGLAHAGEGFWLFATSFFNQSNDFAGYISLSLPFLFLLPLYKDYHKHRWLVLAMTLITVFTLTFTGSKLNYLVTIISSGLALIVLFLNKSREIFVYLVLVSSVLIMLNPSIGPRSVAWLQSNLLNRQLNTAAIDRIEGQEIQSSLEEFNQGFGSAEIRKNLIVNGVKVVLTEPQPYLGLLVGVGAGQVETYMKIFSNTDNVRNLHNWWLEVYVNYGFFVGTSYVLLYLFLLFRSFRLAFRFGQGEFMRYFYFSISLILVVFFFTSISPSSSIGYVPLWFTLGLAIAAVSLPSSLYNSSSKKLKGK
jgi:teichuronic acid biosynthesis protein TuaE